MDNLINVPLPPHTHFVGILFLFEVEGVQNIMSLKDKDLMKDRVNLKLPGGSNKKEHEEYSEYKNALFKTLEDLNFEEKTIIKIYRHEKKRIKLFEGQEDLHSLNFVLRTMVMETLEGVGYYPMDLEPKVVYFIEKGFHTQYFLEVKTLIDSKGNQVEIPNMDDNFKPLDLDVSETRIHLPFIEFQNLIHSHQVPVKKYALYLKNNKGLGEQKSDV